MRYVSRNLFLPIWVYLTKGLSQLPDPPFLGLEIFTGQLGAYVPAGETVATCRAILDGVYDEVEEEEFLFVTSFGG